MERTTIYADHAIACELMDSLYALYIAIVDSMGGKESDPNLRKEGEKYARDKFCELADEFENKLPMRWVWVADEEDEQKND